MILGSLMLYDAPETGLRISWFVIIPTVGATAGLVVFAVSMGLRALYRPAVHRRGGHGGAGWRGASARSSPEGQVLVDGELWRAVAEDGPVPAGETVRVARWTG